MASDVTLESAKKAVLFPFQSRRWGLKLLIGSALSLANTILPIIPLIPAYGYFSQIAKRVILADQDPDLPEWDDWGLFFSDGIKVFGANALYMLPGGLSLMLGYLLMFTLNFAFMFDPRFYTDPEAVMPAFFLGSFAGTLAGMFFLVVGMLLMAAANLFLLPALGHLLATGRFGAAFRVREWWPMFKANLGGYILTLLLLTGVYLVLIWSAYALYFTVILCFLMPFAMMAAGFLMNAIHFSLLAVAYRDGKRKLADMPA